MVQTVGKQYAEMRIVSLLTRTLYCRKVYSTVVILHARARDNCTCSRRLVDNLIILSITKLESQSNRAWFILIPSHHSKHDYLHFLIRLSIFVVTRPYENQNLSYSYGSTSYPQSPLHAW